MFLGDVLHKAERETTFEVVVRGIKFKTNDEEFNESYTRFTESIVISENDSCVNFDDEGNEEGNAESSEDDEDAPEKDTSFESRLSRLSLRAAQKYSLSLALQNEQKKLDLAYDASALKSPAKPETITEETEGQANEQDEKPRVLDPEYMTAAEEQSKADDQQQQQQSSNKEKGKNRLSASADELLKDLHNSKLVLQGMDENIERRKKEYMKLFLHSDRIYSSPLTRALQTAVISMEGHRCLGQSGITLYSVIREVKRLGGLDTVGIECGEGIAKRLRSEFYQHTPHFLEKDKLDHLLASFPLEVNDADQPWWTAMTSTERTVEQQERVREFLTFARYCDAKLPVFVGHSLFFKAFYSRRLSHELIANRQSLSENLKKFRLSNASMLAVTVRFQDKENGTSDAMIIDADLIFGGGFHGVGVDDPDGSQHTNLNMDETYHGGQSTRDSHGGEGGGSGNHRGSIFAESPLKFASSLESNNIQNIFNSIKTNEFTSNLHQEMKEKADILSKGVKKLSEKIYDIFEMN
jgi:broad specificity phosphatase PhoE